jgi:hypothetical protein
MRRALVLVTLALAAACGRPPAPVVAPAARCDLLRADSVTDTLVVGVPGAVDPAQAPVPQTPAERLVFGTLYEPLIRLDCDGRVIPALAAQWEREGPRRWRFTLRQNARYWDGTPVTSQDVVAAWNGRAVAWAESLSTPDPRNLTVLLASPDTAALRELADPRLAVARPAANGEPPEGTTAYRVTMWTPGEIEAVTADPQSRLVQFRLDPGADPRDLLDQGADLVVTGDPEALRYAAGRGALDLVPLPWAWTYVLMGPWAIPPTDAAALPGLLDAVRGDVRLAEPPFWWTKVPGCSATDSVSTAPAPGGLPSIAYLKTDRVARDLADRLAALSAEGQTFVGTGPMRTQGLTAPGSAPMLIQAVPRRAYGRCHEARLGAAVPLVDVRRALIARRGRVHIVVDWDGTPRLVTP